MGDSRGADLQILLFATECRIHFLGLEMHTPVQHCRHDQIDLDSTAGSLSSVYQIGTLPLILAMLLMCTCFSSKYLLLVPLQPSGKQILWLDLYRGPSPAFLRTPRNTIVCRTGP